MATSDSSGAFKIDRSGCRPPADCRGRERRLGGAGQHPAVGVHGDRVGPELAQPESGNRAGAPTASATVTLTAPAPAGGAVVSVASSNIGAVTVPATLTVPAGATLGDDLLGGDQRC